MADSQGAAKPASTSGFVNFVRNLDMRWVAFGLSALASLAHGIISGELPLTGLVPASWDDPIKAYCGLYLYIFPVLIGGHAVTAIKWPTAQNAVKALVWFVVLIGALVLVHPANAQTVPLPTPNPLIVKARPQSQPFSTASGSGWYMGVGTEGALASSSVSGTNFPSLTGGNLTADGGSIGIDAGYIWGNCFLGTWCQVEVDGKYQNISGANAAGSVNSLWSVSEEFDVGAQLFQTIFAAVGNLGTNFPTFNPTSLLPSAVAVATTPRQYFGFVADEFEIGGTFGSASGQTWAFAPGIKTGYRWQTLNASGQPNDGSLNVFAEILWPSRGVTFDNVFAAGAPVTLNSAAEMGTIYLAGIHYDFGL